MDKLIIILCTLICFGCKEDGGLGDFKWKNRILLIINSDKEKLSKKIKSEYVSELEDRDLVIIEIYDSKVFLNNMEASKPLSESVYRKIRKELEDDAFILIGKDGKIKHRYKSYKDINLIFKDIDSMPMRIKEMQE